MASQHPLMIGMTDTSAPTNQSFANNYLNYSMVGVYYLDKMSILQAKVNSFSLPLWSSYT